MLEVKEYYLLGPGDHCLLYEMTMNNAL